MFYALPLGNRLPPAGTPDYCPQVQGGTPSPGFMESGFFPGLCQLQLTQAMHDR